MGRAIANLNFKGKEKDQLFGTKMLPVDYAVAFRFVAALMCNFLVRISFFLGHFVWHPIMVVTPW